MGHGALCGLWVGLSSRRELCVVGLSLPGLFPDNTEIFKYFIYSIVTTSDLYAMVGSILILISQDIIILRLNVVFYSYDSFRFIYFLKTIFLVISHI